MDSLLQWAQPNGCCLGPSWQPTLSAPLLLLHTASVQPPLRLSWTDDPTCPSCHATNHSVAHLSLQLSHTFKGPVPGVHPHFDQMWYHFIFTFLHTSSHSFSVVRSITPLLHNNNNNNTTEFLANLRKFRRIMRIR